MSQSTSLFNATASLASTAASMTNKPTVPSAGRSFTVSGGLESEEKGDKERQVHVFVIIEQTAQDVDKNSSAKTKAVAKGNHLETGTTKSLTKWSVKVKVQNGAEFVPGPATGTALTVELSDNPIGFETYTWMERITLIP